MLLIVVFRSCVLWLSTDRLNPDKVVQIAVARSLIAGHGLTQRELVTNGDEVELVEHPMVGWAPGYALLQACGMFVLDEVVLFNVVLDLAAICALLGAWFYLMWKCFANEEKMIPLVCAAMWVLLPNSLDCLTSNCLVSSALFFCGLAFIPQWVAHPKHFVFGLAAGMLCGLATWIQFRFLPLNAVVLAAASWNAWCCRDTGRSALRIPLGVAIGIAITIVPLVVLQFLRLGSLTGGTLASPGGVYWSHLLAFYPFPLDAIGYDQAMRYLMYKTPVLGAILSRNDVRIGVSIAVVALSFGAIAASLRATDATVPKRTLSCTVIAGGCAAGVIILMTSWFSLRHPMQQLGSVAWTPVQEDRYFFQIQPFLWLAVAGVLTTWMRRSHTGFRIVAFAGVLAMSVAAIATQRVWVSYAMNHHGMRAHLNKEREHTQSLATFYMLDGLAKRGRTVVLVGEGRAITALTRPAMIAGAFILNDGGDGMELRNKLPKLLGAGVLLVRVTSSSDSDRFVFRVYDNQLGRAPTDAGWLLEELGI